MNVYTKPIQTDHVPTYVHIIGNAKRMRDSQENSTLFGPVRKCAAGSSVAS